VVWRERAQTKREDRKMMSANTWRAMGMLLIVVLLTGCGSGNSSMRATSHAENGGPAPVAVVGRYTVTLKRGDLPANTELAQSSLSWTLTIANSGGPNGGRAFTITNATQGVLESSSFRVEGTNILLHQEECTASGGEKLYDNEYSYKVTGQTLRFTTIKNQCSDRVAQTVLTSEPWTRIAG
jgi:hypothetical protein